MRKKFFCTFSRRLLAKTGHQSTQKWVLVRMLLICLYTIMSPNVKVSYLAGQGITMNLNLINKNKRILSPNMIKKYFFPNQIKTPSFICKSHVSKSARELPSSIEIISKWPRQIENSQRDEFRPRARERTKI